MVSKKNTVKYPYPSCIKIGEILIIDTHMASKKDNTSPTLVTTLTMISWRQGRLSPVYKHVRNILHCTLNPSTANTAQCKDVLLDSHRA